VEFVNAINTPVGLRLKEKRLERQLTQAQVAKLCSLSVATICELEKWPEDKPLPPSAARYAEEMGVEILESVSVTHDLRPLPRRGARSDGE
jgi:transcriptional regulator with XRE-family HTH domain